MILLSRFLPSVPVIDATSEKRDISETCGVAKTMYSVAQTECDVAKSVCGAAQSVCVV